jgi:hypothetical protein
VDEKLLKLRQVSETTMNIYHAALLLNFALVLIMVSGCTQPSEDLVTPSSTVPALVTSTKISTPSFTPLPTETHIPILTPTIVPTLPVEDAQARLLELLSNNANCRLPCLWGITPGLSTDQEAQTILAPLGSVSDFTSLVPSPGDISPRYIDGSFVIYTRVAYLYSENGTVNRIAFNTEAHQSLGEGDYKDIFDSKFFGEKINAYTLPQVLSDLGVPGEALISTFGGPLTRGGTGGFDLLLLYPDQGVLINYTTQLRLNGKEVRGCLTNAHVEMDLHASGQPALFNEALKKTDWAVKMNSYKPLEEATSMSVQDFYETFRVSTDTCIETSAEIWPVPEP